VGWLRFLVLSHILDGQSAGPYNGFCEGDEDLISKRDEPQPAMGIAK
jgi:hypothetical protein